MGRGPRAPSARGLCDRTPSGLSPGTWASAERTQPGAFSPAGPWGGSHSSSWRGLGGAGASVTGPRPGPAPLRSRLGRREEEGCSARTARGAPLLHARVRVSGSRPGGRAGGRGGRDLSPRPSPDASPRDRGRRKSRGPGEARPARGRGPWRDSCERAGIFSLNPAVPCRLRNPRVLPLPNAGGLSLKKKPLNPGQRVPGGPGAASNLRSDFAWGELTCHRGLPPPRVPGLESKRRQEHPLLTTTSSLRSAGESPELAVGRGRVTWPAWRPCTHLLLCGFRQAFHLL